MPELKDLKVEVSKKNTDGTMATEDVPANRAITIQDLMRHTSGFFYAGAMQSKRLKEAYEQANIEARDEDISGDEMLKRLGQIPWRINQAPTSTIRSRPMCWACWLSARPRSHWTWLLQEMVIGPLGMKDTAFWVPAGKGLAARGGTR